MVVAEQVGEKPGVVLQGGFGGFGGEESDGVVFGLVKPGQTQGWKWAYLVGPGWIGEIRCGLDWLFWGVGFGKIY